MNFFDYFNKAHPTECILRAEGGREGPYNYSSPLHNLFYVVKGYFRHIGIYCAFGKGENRQKRESFSYWVSLIHFIKGSKLFP